MAVVSINFTYFYMTERLKNMRQHAVVNKDIMQWGMGKVWKRAIHNYELYILILPTFLYYLVFQYFPMYGVQLAFKDFIAVKGIMGSPWIGFDSFIRFFNSYHFWSLLKNTFGISIYQLIVGFPVPIILALMMNELRQKRIKKFLQTVTYAPHFISVVVIVGMMMAFLSPNTGIINQVIRAFGGTTVDFLARPEWFKTVYVISGVWQNAGGA